MFTKMKLLVALVLTAMLAPVVYADTMVPFGVVHRVDYDKENALVINDRYYPMALNMKVKDQKGRTVTRFALKKGQKVRFNLTDGNQVDQIWVLDANAKEPLDN